MGKICRNIRAQWTQESLTSAMNAVRLGRIGQREASRRFKIPRRTLRNHLLSGKGERKLGRSSILTQEQEKDLVNRIIRLAEVGYPYTVRNVRRQVYRFVELNNIRHNFNKNEEMAGRGWSKLFLKRNPELSNRKAQNMNPARAQKLNPIIVGDYFTKLGNILDNLGFKNKPERLYNMDEKGCRLTLHHQQTVLAKKGEKRLHLVAPEHAENVTVVGCVSACGSAIPPMIIFKGKRFKPEFEDNLPAGTLVKMAQKGSMTAELFVEFIRHLAKFKIGGPILLLFDGAKCHLDFSIVDEADKHQITLLCLPSNTTHELQPLDKAVYRSFEAHWDQQVLLFWEKHPERVITKSRFNHIFSKVWSRCMTNENIVSGFRATGMYPYDPSAIPVYAFAPSTLTELPYNASDQESDSDDECSLAVLQQRLRLKQKENLNNSFYELMDTPDLIKKKNDRAPRRKALNYKAQVVTKSLFQQSDNCNPSTSQSTVNNPNSSWYCPLCQISREASMRRCINCHTWAHDECLGYTSSDDDDYICIECEA